MANQVRENLAKLIMEHAAYLRTQAKKIMEEAEMLGGQERLVNLGLAIQTEKKAAEYERRAMKYF